MPDPILNFDDFELPFISNVPDYPDADEEESEDFSFDSDHQKELMEDGIPKEALFLGTFENSVSNWTTWSLEADYYLMPLKGGEFDWALFRLNWDDNWGNWDWSFDARLKGMNDKPMEAARLMLTELWKTWDIDLSNPDGWAYQRFLERLA